MTWPVRGAGSGFLVIGALLSGRVTTGREVTAPTATTKEQGGKQLEAVRWRGSHFGFGAYCCCRIALGSAVFLPIPPSREFRRKG